MDQLIATAAAGFSAVLLLATYRRTSRIEAVLRDILATLDGDDELSDGELWRLGKAECPSCGRGTGRRYGRCDFCGELAAN